MSETGITPAQREFPIQRANHTYKGEPYPRTIPWSVAELAYTPYSNRYGTSQTLHRMAERGGFHPEEMDEFLPDWRERCSEVAALRAALDTLTAQVASLTAERDEARQERDQWIAFRNGDVGVVERLQSFLDTYGQSKAKTREDAIYDRIEARERQARADAFAEAVTVVEQAQVVDAGNLDWDAACDYILTKLREAAAHHGATPTEGQ